jgi:hypothetical protein
MNTSYADVLEQDKVRWNLDAVEYRGGVSTSTEERTNTAGTTNGELTFSILPAANPTTTTLAFHATHFNEGTIMP